MYQTLYWMYTQCTPASSLILRWAENDVVWILFGTANTKVLVVTELGSMHLPPRAPFQSRESRAQCRKDACRKSKKPVRTWTIQTPRRLLHLCWARVTLKAAAADWNYLSSIFRSKRNMEIEGYKCKYREDFPGGSVVKNLPASAGGHRFDPWSGRIPHALGQPGPHAATAEPVPPREQPPQREACAPHLERSPLLPQPEKTCAQQQSPSASPNE